MNNLYWLLAALLLMLISFRLYLRITDQHVHFHWQNTSDEKHPEPLWREGRCWFYLSYNDDNKHHKWYPPPTIHPWWHLFHKSSIEFKVYMAADEHDLGFFFGFLFGSAGLTISGLSFFRWLFSNVTRMGFGYDTGFDFDPWRGHLTFYLAYNDMASGPGLRVQVPRWYRRLLLRLGRPRKKVRRLLRPTDPLPSGIHFWRAANWSRDYSTGGGVHLSFDFDRMIRGSYEREVENIGEPLVREIPIEPDNTLDLHYFATFQRQKEIRWRGHFPWRKRIAYYWEFDSKAPPMHAGKGENSYDQDDDGIFGAGLGSEALEDAITEYVEKVNRDRKKYGMPDAISEAQQKSMRL